MLVYFQLGTALGTSVSNILFKIQNILITKMHLKISAAKRRPFLFRGRWETYIRLGGLDHNFIRRQTIIWTNTDIVDSSIAAVTPVRYERDKASALIVPNNWVTYWRKLAKWPPSMAFGNMRCHNNLTSCGFSGGFLYKHISTYLIRRFRTWAVNYINTKL